MKIITSNASSGAYMGVIEELKKRSGERNIIIAPDRFTASVEKGVMISLGVESTFDVEVTSFTRLANKLIGRQINKCLTPEGSVMLLRKVINDCADSLTYYGKAARKDGFENELYAALTAIRNSGLQPEALEEKVKASFRLSRKAHDIGMIYRGYLEALSESYSDSSTRLMALAKHIEEHPESVSDANFYCSDIYEFSSYELDILRGLAANAMSLTVGIVTGEGNPNGRIYPDYMISRLRSLTPDRTEIIFRPYDLHPAISAISRRLFGYTGGKLADNSDGKVCLRRARNRQDEVLALALDVMREVRGGGRYSHFEVFVSDIADYEADIRSVFGRYDIPYHIDKKELMSEQTKARYLTLALDAVKTHMRMREVVDFAKNPLFYGEDADSVFEFENYVLKYNIDRSRFMSPFALGQDAFVFDGQRRENDIPERVRQKLISALTPFEELSSGAHVVREYTDAARRLLSAADDNWRSHILRLVNFSKYYVKCAEQVDKKLDSILDEIDGAVKNDITFEEFASYVKAMLKTLTISLVPPMLDCVFFGDLDSRYMGEHSIYILGATNDKLPKRASGGTVITVKDEEDLKALGVEITPDAKRKVYIDMYAITDIMKKPCDRLVVSYPESGENPSTVIAELKRMLSDKGDADRPLQEEYVAYDGYDASDGLDEVALRLSSYRSRYYEVLRHLGTMPDAEGEEASALAVAYKKLDDVDRRAVDNLGREVADIALKGGVFDSATSVSRLETFFECPYEHYFSYILKLTKVKSGDFEGTENGIILHDVLERFFSAIRDGEVDDNADITRMADEFFDAALKDKGYERLLERSENARAFAGLKREAENVCRDLYAIKKRSSFTPRFLEAKIGEGDIESLYLDDGKVRLRGIIDRVDVWQDNFAVIDYKTYKSADLTLKELFYGQKLQLYLYMKSILNSFDWHPVGIFYLPIFSDFSDDKTGRYKLRGLITSDTEMWDKFDSLASDSPKDAVIPYKLKRGGALNADSNLTEKQFGMLAEYALQLARRGAKQIAEGYIKPSPVGDACDFCDYIDICKMSKKAAREQASVTIETISGIFDKEAEQNDDK